MPYIGKSNEGFGIRERFLYLASAGDTTVSGTDSISEEHTSELQSRSDIVCRLLLENKKKEK